MAGLVLGPLLRYTGSTQATVWVERTRRATSLAWTRVSCHFRSRATTTHSWC